MMEKIMNWLGYVPKDKDYDKLRNEYTDLHMDIRGLVNSIGYLERECEEQNLLLSGLILANGVEETSLTKDFLSDILSRHLETTFGQNDDGDIKLVVQLRPDNTEEV